MVIDREELAWTAGVFEGEGSIFKANPKGRAWSINISLGNTDRHLLHVFQSIVGGLGSVGKPLRKGRKKSLWIWRTGRFEHVQAIVAMLWLWLSPRRHTTYSVLAKAYHKRKVKKSLNTGKSVDNTPSTMVRKETA